MTSETQPPQAGGRRTADVVATVVLSVVLVLGSVLALGFSFFFVAITVDCDEPCRTDLLSWAYVVTWGGIGLTLLGTVVAVWVSAARRRVMFVWPLLGIGCVVIFEIVALSLVHAVMGS